MSDANSPFSAEVGADADLQTTVVLLTYDDRSDAARRISVGIAPELGSNMFRLRVGDHDIIHCEPESLMQRRFTGNFVLWPLPNRVRDRRYTYQGRAYSLADVMRPEGNDVLIHGLVFDRPWQHDAPTATADAASLTTWIDITPDSPHFDAYPFPSRLTLTYTLARDGVTVAYSVRNNGGHELPYGFALHPYFAALSGRDATSISIPATTVMEADDDLLPTGRLLNVESVMYAMFDLRQPRPLAALNLDHVYTGLVHGEGAAIYYPHQGLALRLSASDDFTHMVVYAPPGGSYCCIENQTCSTDAINLHEQGRGEMAHLLEVGPQQTASGFIRYTVEHGP